MKIFKDKLSGDELFTDVYQMVEEPAYIKFCAKFTSRRNGQIDDSLIGGNASAEQAQEEMDDCEECGLDFAMNARLFEGGLSSKKDFQKYFKDYFKRLQEKKLPGPCENEDQCEYEAKVKDFKSRAKAFFDMVMENHKDLTTYFGEHDYARENNCCFVKWLDDKNVEVYCFRDGLDEEKC